MICLTIPDLVKEIENVLEDFPEDFYQLASSCPNAHHQLLISVIKRLPSCYLSKSPGTICFSLRDVYLSDLIRQSLFQFRYEALFERSPSAKETEFSQQCAAVC